MLTHGNHGFIVALDRPLWMWLQIRDTVCRQKTLAVESGRKIHS